MRATALTLAVLLLTACSRSPQEQRIHDIREQADTRADQVEDEAKQRAAPLDEQAKTLRTQAEKVGGYDGKRMAVLAEALEKKADLIREQGDDKSEAIRAEANAKVKALESR